MNIYLIQQADDFLIDEDADLFWNSEHGWGSIEDADAYTEQERYNLNLPIGGEWLQFKRIS